MSGRVEDKEGAPIKQGDSVFTKIRGGKREGEVTLLSFSHKLEMANYLQVDKVVMSEEEAKKENVKNPPKVWILLCFLGSQTKLAWKVLFEDQHGHHVAHNPGTLEVTDKK